MTGSIVLAPLNGSKDALCALPIARSLADLLDLPLRILHVTEQVEPLATTAGRLGLAPDHLRRATLDVRAGDPAAVIVEVAAERQARLIVMSAQMASLAPTDGIGDAALAVLRGAPCPVVLVNPARAANGWALRRLLVPHSGSPTVSDALRPAAEFARKAGAELVVLQAANAECAEETGSIAPPLYMDQLQHAWPAWSDEFLQRLACICPLSGLRVRLRVERGEPAQETIRAANEEAADLVVLTWNGRASVILRAVLRDAPCPVMVTRVFAS